MEKNTYPRTITVTFEAEDGKNPMPPENVELREMPVKRYTKLAECVIPYQKLVDAVLMKPNGWADSLTPQSFRDVYTGIKEANPLFFDYCRETMQDVKEMGLGPKA